MSFMLSNVAVPAAPSVWPYDPEPASVDIDPDGGVASAGSTSSAATSGKLANTARATRVHPRRMRNVTERLQEESSRRWPPIAGNIVSTHHGLERKSVQVRWHADACTRTRGGGP